ncbi:MAG: hypothetical protein COV48_02880 [Elusimicrobia bacterium CG11_big_fil_rev_8_21_14_0_20_64_6]|nr:MAG: hypothetical protein COV48_02880 [Elusimicrobia bacterium CG11_big_fil_rev_8_21_14_0_20_64_6]
MTRLLAVAAVLALAVTARAETALSPALAEASRATVVSRTSVREGERISTLRAAASFVPTMCSVESWCLVKATDCFLGQMTHPTGLWKAVAQYSVVRRVQALCPTGRYGSWESRTFMGPVEPQVFSSGIEPSEEAAVASTMKLCRDYRTDWVSAAPACSPD